MASHPQNQPSEETSPPAGQVESPYVEGVLRPEPPPALPVSRSIKGEPRAFLERLVGQDPTEILARLQVGDPLDLSGFCRRRLLEEFMILEPTRLLEKTLIEVSYELFLARSENPDSRWLEKCTASALERLLTEDANAELSRPKPLQDDERFRFISNAFGVPLEDGRRATVRFCALPRRTRRAFFALLVDQKPLRACVAEGLGTHESLRDDISNALRALGRLSEEEVAEYRRRAKS